MKHAVLLGTLSVSILLLLISNHIPGTHCMLFDCSLTTCSKFLFSTIYWAVFCPQWEHERVHVSHTVEDYNTCSSCLHLAPSAVL